MSAILNSQEILTLSDISERCWDGRIGEQETLPLVNQITEDFTKGQLQYALARLLNEVSQLGRQALAERCCCRRT